MLRHRRFGHAFCVNEVAAKGDDVHGPSLFKTHTFPSFVKGLIDEQKPHGKSVSSELAGTFSGRCPEAVPLQFDVPKVGDPGPAG